MAFGDFTVVRAGTKWVLNSSGVLSEVANNVPAFEFNANGTYRGLLVEPAGTNLCLRSEDLGTTWAFADATSSLNSASSPNGAVTADSIIDNTTNTFHGVAQNFTVTSGISYTISAFFKANTLTWVRLAQNSSAGGSTQVNAWYNIATGVVGTVGAGGTARIENYGNGWYRCSLTVTTTGTSFQYAIRTATADNQTTYAGTEQSLLFWGAQLETGSVATSYIPTVASTANRVADSVTLTGASSLIGQSAGTLYIEFERGSYASATTQRIFSVSDNTTGNRISLIVASTTSFGQLLVNTATVNQANITRSVATSGINKFAVAYALNDIDFYVNGSSVGTDTLATIPATSQVNLGINEQATTGTENFLGWIRSVALFPTRLANATLETLTTL
jgi:hypothetical protein